MREQMLPEVLPGPVVPGLDRLDTVTGYINAGGRGTRLQSVIIPDAKTGVSKALVEIGEPPITMVEYQVDRMKRLGLFPILVNVGDHAHVAEYIADLYDHDEVIPVTHQFQLGNGGDLLRTVHEQAEHFQSRVLIANVDTLLDIDEGSLLDQHDRTLAALTIAVTTRQGVPNEGSFLLDQDHRVLFSREASRNQRGERQARKEATLVASSTGMLIVQTEVLQDIPLDEERPTSLYREVFAAVLSDWDVFAYNNHDRLFIDAGTRESLELIAEDERYNEFIQQQKAMQEVRS